MEDLDAASINEFGDGDDKDDEDYDERIHVELLRSLGEVDTNISKKALKGAPKQHLKRKEAVSEPTEYFIKKHRSGTRRSFSQLLDTVKSTDEAAVEKVKNVIEANSGLKKTLKTLDAPTETNELNRARRTVVYEQTKEALKKWDPIVRKNRTSNQLMFPAKDTGSFTSKNPFKQIAKKFIPKTPLEEDIAKILYGEEYLLEQKAEQDREKELAEAVENNHLIEVEQAMATHNEMARFRALQSYEIAKAKRKKKIKSKKYHRLMRKEKIKQQMKEFEEMKEKDPEGALMKLDELNKSRIQERMTLKHKNSTKWARMTAARSKYSKESRAALKERLLLSNDLKKKVKISSDEESGDDGKVGSNSTVKFGLPSTNMTSENHMQADRVKLKTKEKVDPNKFLAIDKPSRKKDRELDLKTLVVTLSEEEKSENEDYGEENETRNLINEAFMDDDVIADFNKQKAEEAESSKPKSVDLTLPGWGEWGGKDIKPSEKKRKKFTLKAAIQKPRKDAKLPHVIYNERANLKIKDYQMKEVPFPYTNIKDVEGHIKAPIGRTWVPEQAMKKFTAPKVITRLGHIIKPISDSEIKYAPQKIRDGGSKNTNKRNREKKVDRARRDLQTE